MVSASVDKTIGVWKVSSGERIKTLIGYSSFVSSVAFSPDGKYLASGSWDYTMVYGNFLIRDCGCRY